MILEGKTLAAALRAPLQERAQSAARKLGRPPGLFAVGSTDDYGAHVYLQKEVLAAEKLGVRAQIYEVSSATPADEFLSRLQAASQDPTVDAILIARPLPAALAQSGFEQIIAPQKDIDGMSAAAMGNLFLCKSWADVQRLPTFVPCTALAVTRLLDYYKLDIQGWQAAVIGRSPTVGRPLAHLLSCRNATVTLCHSFTQDLAAAVQNKQLICCAAGHPGLISASMVHSGAYIIDIATNLDKQGRLCGDAEAEALLAQGCHVSPVPGGVGPVTLACLLENIIISVERAV